MVVSPAPVRVPGQRPLTLIFTSVTSIANDKGDNEMIPGADIMIFLLDEFIYFHSFSGSCVLSHDILDKQHTVMKYRTIPRWRRISTSL